LPAALVGVVEQGVTHPAQRLFACALCAVRMSMQKVRAEFDVETRPHGLRLTSHLDSEVLGLDEEGIAAAPITLGLDLRAQPFRAMDRAGLLGDLRRLFRFTELAVHLSAHTALRGEVAGVQTGEEHNSLSSQRFGRRLSFRWTTAPLVLWHVWL